MVNKNKLYLREYAYQAVNIILCLDNIDAVDKWIDLHYQVVWSNLFVLIEK